MISTDDEKKIKKAFGRKEMLTSVYTPMYPYSSERELKRVMMAYTNLVIAEVNKKIPEMQKQYRLQRDIDKGLIREDGLMDLRQNLLDSLVSITDEVEKKNDLSGFDKLVVRTGRSTAKHISREWNRSIKKTFKVEKEDDDLAGLFLMLLTAFGSKAKTRMRDLKTKLTNDVMSVVMSAYLDGESSTDAFRKVHQQMSKLRRRAGIEARDMVGDLTADMGKQVSEYYGCDEYMWISKRDDKVRECHRHLDGHIFRWDDPPEMWYRTKNGIVYTGRRCHPGQDYGCRCVARIIFTKKSAERIFR